MSRADRARRLRAVLPALAALAAAWAPGCAPVPALGGEAPVTFPYEVALRVDYGPQGGPETLRQDLTAELRVALERCYEAVLPAEREPGPGALRLDVVMAELEERVEFEGSLAQAHDPRLPPHEIGRRALVRARVTLALALGDRPDAIIRRRRMNESASHVGIPGDDPRQSARLELVDHLVHRAGEFACRGTPDRLRRRIEAVRADR